MRNEKMNCLEFKRLALSDPNSAELQFVKHHESCPDCAKYLAGIKKMDADLASALDVAVPSDLIARLQLNQELQQDATSGRATRRYAIAASFAVALFVAGFVLNSQINLNNQIDQDYQTLLAGVTEHMKKQPMTPVWDTARANNSVNTLLASYDGDMQLKYLENLQFGRVCPMGRYKGLHATIDTPNGQVTFAYIKGESVGELFDSSYEGYLSRIKPVRGGNLIILSRNKKALNQADKELEEAIYWKA